MALSAAANYPAQGAGLEMSPQVATTLVVYPEAITAIGTKYHGTADSIGRARPWAAAAHTLPIGIAEGGHGAVTGDSTAGVNDLTTGTRRQVQLATHRGQVFQLPITGLAGTAADEGREVFATDDGTFTFTRATRSALIGTVVKYATSSVAWVRLLLGDDQILLSKAGQGRFNMVKSISLITATAVAATTWPAPARMKVIGGTCKILVKTDGSAGAITLQLKNGTTSMTGATFAIQAAGADAINAEIALGTITEDGTAYASEGDDIRIALTQAGTTATAGLAEISLLCEYQIGF